MRLSLGVTSMYPDDEQNDTNWEASDGSSPVCPKVATEEGLLILLLLSYRGGPEGHYGGKIMLIGLTEGKFY